MTDERMIDKITALIAKAESTEHEAEARTFMAKAQELMTKHAIEATMLRTQGPADEIVTRHIPLSSQWYIQDLGLLGAVARANHCRAWRSGRGKSWRGVLIGFSTDVANVETLYASLQLQLAGFIRDVRSPYYGVSDATWRRSWRDGFAMGIDDRLAEAARTMEETADQAYGGTLLPALLDKDAAVEAAEPEMGKPRQRSAYGEAMAGGQFTAQHADVGAARVGGGARGIGYRR